MEKCFVCGRNINIAKNNCMQTPDGYIHKKCPIGTDKLSNVEKQQWESLRSTITEQYLSKPSDYYKEHAINWKAVSNQIKTLRNQGYTYEEIEYATKEVFKEFGMFYGFGGVVNRIVGIIAKRNRQLETLRGLEAKCVTVDESIDLTNIINESEDW